MRVDASQQSPSSGLEGFREENAIKHLEMEKRKLEDQVANLEAEKRRLQQDMESKSLETDQKAAQGEDKANRDFHAKAIRSIEEKIRKVEIQIRKIDRQINRLISKKGETNNYKNTEGKHLHKESNEVKAGSSKKYTVDEYI